MSDEYIAKAAVAEALHVDGEFLRAARLWAMIADKIPNCDEAPLKAAISFLAAGNSREGFAWLNRCVRRTASNEVLYVTSQWYWSKGLVQRVLDDLSGLERDCQGQHAGMLDNLHGVYLWRLGKKTLARELFSRSLRTNPNDACALINIVSSGFKDIDEELAIRMLSSAARLAPHRCEPYVLLSRLLRRRGKSSDATRSMRIAKLRQLSTEVPKCIEVSPVRVTANGKVEGSVFHDYFAKLRITYSFPLGSGRLPRILRLNRGYKNVSIGGVVAALSDEECVGRDPRAVTQVFPVPVSAWRVTAKQSSLEVECEGLLLRSVAHAADNSHEIELEGLSGWIPIMQSEYDIRYEWALKLPGSFDWIASSGRGERGSASLIALDRPARTDSGGIRVLGHWSEEGLRLSSIVAAKAMRLWSRRLDSRAVPMPTLVVVRRPGSTLCYARDSYIRVASGSLETPNAVAIVIHEVGHLWWGIAAQFAEGSEWLSEALAEYSLHLAEQEGLLQEYSRATLEALAFQNGGVLPSSGLLALSKSRAHLSAFALRAKGGFLISALRRIMGDTSFSELLRKAYEHGVRIPLDSYTFFALASRIHGASLNWMANQWVNCDADLSLSADLVDVGFGDGIHSLTFLARCRGLAVPGAPVEFAIKTADGRSCRVDVNLNLGIDQVNVLTRARPICIEPDPDWCWYATRESCFIDA